VHFPDSGHDYEAHIERLRDDLAGWIEDLSEKNWWTQEQEHALRCLMLADHDERSDLEGEDDEG
jgi:hypothetical protein